MKLISPTTTACVAVVALLAGAMCLSGTPLYAAEVSVQTNGNGAPSGLAETGSPQGGATSGAHVGQQSRITVVATSYLPVVTGNPQAPEYDMLEFMADNDGILYEVRHSSGSQARHQTQTSSGRFFHTKGNEISAEWEELWSTEELIYRGTDTSPGSGQYYTLYEDDVPGSAWSPRHWRVGDLFERDPFVVFYRKSDCGIVASGYQRSWLRFEAYHPTYEFSTGIKLSRVIELTWLLQPDGLPIESYYYAAGFGLVGWGSSDRGESAISEIHAPGQRPNNNRETVTCMAKQGSRLARSGSLNYGPLPPGFRAK